jgi:hypothetical protein
VDGIGTNLPAGEGKTGHVELNFRRGRNDHHTIWLEPELVEPVPPPARSRRRSKRRAQ